MENRDFVTAKGLDDLFLVCGVFSSDDDLEVVEDICVGYDEQFNLVVLLEHADYEEPGRNCRTCAVVAKDGAFGLARRLGVGMADLPRRLGEWGCEGYEELVNPTLGETRGCFRHLLDFLAQSGCRYRLARTYGEDGYFCF